MFEERSIKLDIVALFLLAMVLFLGIALASYDRFDPPSDLVQVYPAPTASAINNACGRAGAYAIYYLLNGLGVGAYYLVGSLTALTGLLLLRREVNQPLTRTIGWGLSLLAISTLASISLPTWTLGPMVGSGGYLGAMGRSYLEANFGNAGSYILSLSVLLAGWLLCTDHLLLSILAVSGIASRKQLLKLRQLKRRSVTNKAEELETEQELEADTLADDEEWAEEDLDEDEETVWQEDKELEPAEIKINSPKSKEPASEAKEEAEEEQEATATGTITSKLKDALTIKKPKKKKKEEPPQIEEVLTQLDAASEQLEDDLNYEIPPLDLLHSSEDFDYEVHNQEVRRKAKVLERTFKNFGFNIRVIEIETGPVIAQYEIQLEAGLRLSKITGLSDDLAIALRVPSVRIVAPIPGKNTVGIEVPNEHRQVVCMREVIEETTDEILSMSIPIYLGKDVSGKPMVVDLAKMPHLLIAGRTGTGKSVCLNSIIISILMTRGPDEVKMLMIDPKMVELSGYRKLPHLMHPVVTDMRKAEAILSWAVEKMEDRYRLLARAGVRHLNSFNQLSEEELRDRLQCETEDEWLQTPKSLPFIVIIADEIADLMMTSGKEVETHIIRLAQKSRAVGIHLILATQKPTVDVITGLIKSNLPARLAFQVASRTDSRVVLDEMGAEKLLGNGDMLFLSPGTSVTLRGQGAYLSDEEITTIVDYVGTDENQFTTELIGLKTQEEKEDAVPAVFKDRDNLYQAAVEVVVRERRGSVSLLQRTLGIGYGRAARLVDYMAEDGIVGEYNGSQAREVMVSSEEWAEMSGGEPAKPAPVRNNKVIPKKEEPEIEAAIEAEEKLRPQKIMKKEASVVPEKTASMVAPLVAEDHEEDSEDELNEDHEELSELAEEKETTKAAKKINKTVVPLTMLQQGKGDSGKTIKLAPSIPWDEEITIAEVNETVDEMTNDIGHTLDEEETFGTDADADLETDEYEEDLEEESEDELADDEEWVEVDEDEELDEDDEELPELADDEEWVEVDEDEELGEDEEWIEVEYEVEDETEDSDDELADDEEWVEVDEDEEVITE